jgi:hypothetical protein
MAASLDVPVPSAISVVSTMCAAMMIAAPAVVGIADSEGVGWEVEFDFSLLWAGAFGAHGF